MSFETKSLYWLRERSDSIAGNKQIKGSNRSPRRCATKKLSSCSGKTQRSLPHVAVPDDLPVAPDVVKQLSPKFRAALEAFVGHDEPRIAESEVRLDKSHRRSVRCRPVRSARMASPRHRDDGPERNAFANLAISSMTFAQSATVIPIRRSQRKCDATAASRLSRAMYLSPNSRHVSSTSGDSAG